jgi:hypothetical protein
MVISSLKHHPYLRDMVVCLCAYEAVAALTGWMPTLTSLQERYRIVGPLILGGLIIHFYLDDLRVTGCDDVHDVFPA